jgi:hypothetical protein
MYSHLHDGLPPLFSPDLTTVSTSILSSLKLAIGEALRGTANHTGNCYDKSLRISALWDFKETFTSSIRSVVEFPLLNRRSILFRWTDWRDHTNDLVD